MVYIVGSRKATWQGLDRQDADCVLMLAILANHEFPRLEPQMNRVNCSYRPLHFSAPKGVRLERCVTGLPHGKESMLMLGSEFKGFLLNDMNLKLYSC